MVMVMVRAGKGGEAWDEQCEGNEIELNHGRYEELLKSSNITIGKIMDVGDPRFLFLGMCISV